jgi:two-component system, NtrC family, sensor kinase
MTTRPSILQSIIDSLEAGIWVINRKFELVRLNSRVLPHLDAEGLSSLRGKHCYQEIFGLREPCENCPALQTFETGRVSRNEISLQRDGQSREFRLTATPLFKKGRKDFSRVVEMIQDVTADKRAEERSRRLYEFNTAIIANAPLSIFTLDTSGRFTSVNQGLASLSGLGPRATEKLIGFNWLENPYTVKCGLADHIRRALKGEPVQLWDFPFITYKGDRTIYMDFRGVPLRGKNGEVQGLLCIIEETTERVKVRAQLMQETKMSALGRLAAGVAHELNNPLAILSAYSELAHGLSRKQEALKEKSGLRELQEYLDTVREQAFRCKRIITDLLDLTRKEGLEVVEVDVNFLLSSLLEFIDFAKQNVRIHKVLSPDLPAVKGDQTALKQVFLNVINNALDAVEGEVAPIITVRSESEGNHVKVEIEDTGMGIPDAIIDKIFEPYFTTKEQGKGMGLGLALCYELLSKMGGSIVAESKPGQGSLFRILLPLENAEGGKG